MNNQSRIESYRSAGFILVELLVAVVLVACVSSVAKANFLYNGDADELCTNDGSYGQYTFGNRFTVGTAPLEVTRLGYADRVDGDGLTDSHQVGIWDASSEALLTSVTVPSGTSATLLNDFRWITLDTPLTLAANTAYVIGGDSGPGPTAADTFRFRLPNPGELGPGLSAGDRRQSAEGAGFVFPTEVGGNDPNEIWASVNMEYSIMTSPPGPPVEQWTLATQDTSLTIGLDRENRPAIYSLNNQSQQFNWAQQPCSIPLPTEIVQNGQNVAADWQLQNTLVDTSNGTKLTLRYISASTGLEFESEWCARPGQGPVHHSSFIKNNGSGPLGISYQPTLALQLTAPQPEEVVAWHFKSSGGSVTDPVGVYSETVTSNFNRNVTTSPSGPTGDAIPLAVLDSQGQHGVYVGTEWSYGNIQISSSTADQQRISVQSGNATNFQTTLQAGQTFEVPPGFVGAYKGDVDDAGNSLRKYIYNYNMPEVLREDTGYPKLQWNAFGATGKSLNSWDSVESKYYPLIDYMADLGFEEVMLDVGWWQDGEPTADAQDWPSGMRAAAEYAKQKGIRFGLYWTDNADMTTEAGRQTRADRIKRLYEEHDVDMWRSDDTSGTLVAPDYWSVKGFYDMVDELAEEIPNFQWENCSSGGRIKDYGAMKRSVKIFNADNFSALGVRTLFHDSSYAMHPIQLEGHLGKFRPIGAVGMKFAFRSMSMGSPEWFVDAPNGGNETAPWTDEEKEAVASVVATYKQKIRPLVRNANLYHIFPRPDGVVWDGIEYYDPITQKGVVYIFKPSSPSNTHRIILKGLDEELMYLLSFEDNSNPFLTRWGADLMNDGVDVTLYGTNISELMFIDAIIPGDANCDGKVDVSDLGILATHYGTIGDAEWGNADFTGDGNVDVSDLGILATNYGTTSPSVAVPEPSIAIMLAGIVLSIVFVQRR